MLVYDLIYVDHSNIQMKSRLLRFLNLFRSSSFLLWRHIKLNCLKTREASIDDPLIEGGCWEWSISASNRSIKNKTTVATMNYGRRLQLGAAWQGLASSQKPLRKQAFQEQVLWRKANFWSPKASWLSLKALRNRMTFFESSTKFFQQARKWHGQSFLYPLFWFHCKSCNFWYVIYMNEKYGKVQMWRLRKSSKFLHIVSTNKYTPHIYFSASIHPFFTVDICYQHHRSYWHSFHRAQVSVTWSAWVRCASGNVFLQSVLKVQHWIQKVFTI